MFKMTPKRLRNFMSRIAKIHGIEGCWTYRAIKNASGYVSMGNGVMAHRVSYEWFVGPIPSGLELDHLCGQRDCVNPHHLEPVTHRENLRRARLPHRSLDVRLYCRNGHPITQATKTAWNGDRCRACHNARNYARLSAVVRSPGVCRCGQPAVAGFKQCVAHLEGKRRSRARAKTTIETRRRSA